MPELSSLKEKVKLKIELKAHQIVSREIYYKRDLTRKSKNSFPDSPFIHMKSWQTVL